MKKKRNIGGSNMGDVGTDLGRNNWARKTLKKIFLSATL